MNQYHRFLTGCLVALKTLESNNEERVLRAYQVLERMRTHLPIMQPESSLMFAHSMYFFVKAEQCIYFGDFECAMFQIRETIHICLLAKKILSDEDSQPMFWIDNLHRRCGKRISYYFEHIKKPKGIECSQSICPICGKLHPNKTGMHLVPLFLIKHLFPRFKELAIEENNAMAYSYGYVGRDLASHINDIRGYELTEEEAELEQLMPNPLTRDYLWCSDCEKRITAIENIMLSVHKKQLHNEEYESKAPYLFWLSVFWRMSIGKMCIQLPEWVEQKIADMIHRTVEPNGIFHWEEVETCFYYGATQCADTREELMGIWGMRKQDIPYLIIIGNLALTFFPSKADTIRFRKHDDVMHFNNGTEKEVWGNLPFLTFWDRHQFIAFENAEYDMTHLGQSTLSDVILPNKERTEWPRERRKIFISDYQFMDHKYPMIIPWSLREIIPKKLEDNNLSDTQLAEGTVYTADEVAFMLRQFLYRQQRLTDNLQAFYDSHPLDKDTDYAPQLYTDGHYTTYIQFRPGELPPQLTQGNVRKLF